MILCHGLKMENISMSEILWNLYEWFIKNGIIWWIIVALFFLFAFSVVHEDMRIIWGIQPIS